MALIRTSKTSGAAVSPVVIPGSCTPNATSNPQTIDLSSYDFNEIVGVTIDFTPAGYTRSVVSSLNNAGSFEDVGMGSYVTSGMYSISVNNSNKSVSIGYNIVAVGNVAVPTTYNILVV